MDDLGVPPSQETAISSYTHIIVATISRSEPSFLTCIDGNAGSSIHLPKSLTVSMVLPHPDAELPNCFRGEVNPIGAVLNFRKPAPQNHTDFHHLQKRGL